MQHRIVQAMQRGDCAGLLDDADAAALHDAIECGGSGGEEIGTEQSDQEVVLELVESGISCCSASSGDDALSIDSEPLVFVDADAAAESDDGTAAAPCAGEEGAGAWRPGRDCGRWVSRAQGLQEQGRVVVVNVALALQNLPAEVRRTMAEFFRLQERSAAAIAARLVGLSVSCVREVVRRVRGDGVWDPRTGADRDAKAPPRVGSAAPPPPSAGSAAPPHVDSVPAAPAREGLRSMVRLALATAAEGQSWRSFVRAAMRQKLAGAELPEWYFSKQFASQAAAIASMCLAALDGEEFNRILPGLNMPSDFAVVADAVSIGSSMFSRHGDLQVCCLSLISPHSGQIWQPMHSGHLVPIGGKGGAIQARALCEALAQHPARWGMAELRSRLACVGGDGALTLGGPDHRHQSPGVAEHLWTLVHPQAGEEGDATPMCTSWDPFHRVDIALWRAVREHPAVLALFDMAKELEYLFGMSDGALIFQAVAAECREAAADGPAAGAGAVAPAGPPGTQVLRAPGGTRKVAYLAGVPGSLVDNFQVLTQALRVRAAWKQAGHGARSLDAIMAAGRRLTEPQTIILMALMQDVLREVVRPFAKQVQKHTEPAIFRSQQSRFQMQACAAGSAALRLQRIVRVLTLCRQHAAPEELAMCLAAFGGGALGRIFPSFFKHAPGLLLAQPVFQGCEIQPLSKHDRSQTMVLGPCCQCCAQELQRAAEMETLAAGGADRSHFADAAGRVGVQLPRANRALPPRFVRVPVWAQHGSDLGRPLPGAEARPRTAERPVARRSALQGVVGKFGRHCKLSPQALLMDIAFEEALAVLRGFLRTAESEAPRGTGRGRASC